MFLIVRAPTTAWLRTRKGMKDRRAGARSLSVQVLEITCWVRKPINKQLLVPLGFGM